MLIPSIDLMGGKIVQLVQGERKALEFDDFDAWIERFSKYPLVQLIDLDAALGQGENHSLMKYFTRRLPCQVGGGLRTAEKVEQVLSLGAKKAILGSALIRNGEIAIESARSLASRFGQDHLVFAIDSRNGNVATEGWRTRTNFVPIDLVRTLDSFCGAFLYTHVDSEGLMTGFPFSVIQQIRAATERRLIAGGGITTEHEIASLDAMKVDAVVGMAIYTGKLNLAT
ncbi:MAG TPA: 1-(5-phosphoribosyl)-5-[(5-phosphoribosylamino)methylideneamino] imidazole-4-carboxamide isomerase [Terriglobales bacterium]|nr:1-(5-phosphoribosyl)-5-[(5-phosphoribosylamino)methylideneamino] imidazole-4-carboxamide isomerase [Terriglobales bacterium]